MSDLAAITELWSAPTGRSARMDRLVERRYVEIPLDSIVPNPYQPRTSLDLDGSQFRELVDNIRSQGLLQPIVVWQSETDHHYTLIAGERRWRAMRLLAEENQRFALVPATVVTLRDTPEAGMLVRALSENVMRSDLSTAETATAIARLRELTGWTYEAIAEQMGMSVSRVHDLAAITRHEVVLEAVADGSITQKQAVVIANGTSDNDAATEVVARSKGRDLASTRRLVKAQRDGAFRKPVDPVVTPPQVIDCDALPISKLSGDVARRDVERAIAATCSVLGYWPERS